MSFEDFLQIAERLSSLGLAPVLMIGLWRVWVAYQRLVDDLRKVNERLDAMMIDNAAEEEGKPPWD